MELFFSPFVFDAAGCAMLAAASALRARHASCPPVGAVVLGVLCGLIGPLLRATLAGQPAVLVLDTSLYPASALGGGICGAVLGRFSWTEGRFYSLIDAAGLQLLACSGVLAVQNWLALSPLGMFLLAAVPAFAPGLLRDAALGDTAALTDEPAYATAPLLGVLLTIGCLALRMSPLTALAAGWGVGVFARALVIRQQT